MLAISRQRARHRPALDPGSLMSLSARKIKQPGVATGSSAGHHMGRVAAAARPHSRADWPRTQAWPRASCHGVSEPIMII